jgi:hypothetical protein
MATSTDPAAPAAPEAQTDAAPAAQDKGTAGVYQYLDETPRTYQFHDGTVITPQQGDVCVLPYDPGDRRWQPSKAKVTRLPDNHRDQIAKTAAEQAEARADILKSAAETGRASS